MDTQGWFPLQIGSAPSTVITENRAGKPRTFMPGMNRRSFEGGGKQRSRTHCD